MSATTITTFILNNLFAVAAGGLMAAYMVYRIWRKFEEYFKQLRSWGDLIFFAAKAAVVLGVMFLVASTIWSYANSAVQSAINSGSLQTAGQLAVDSAALVDYVVSGTGSIAGDGLQNAGVTVPTFAPSFSLTSGGSAAPAFTVVLPNGNRAPAIAPTPKPTPISTLLQTVSGGHDRYTVQPGDTMSSIAKAILDDGRRYPELCAANVQRVGANCQLAVGTQIIVPTDIQAYQRPASVQAAIYHATTPATAARGANRVPVATGAKTYTIVAGDSMYSIASRNGGLGAMYAICTANVAVLGGDCDKLTVGATLVIP